MQTLGIFVKQPIPGMVKTRLAASLGTERAAAAYAAFIADVVGRFRQTGDRRILGYAPDTPSARDYFSDVAGEDYELWPQPDGDLGGRMEAFFREFVVNVAKDGISSDRAILIGSDSPTLPRGFVDQAFELLSDADCVLGPATDGGYYLVGQRGRVGPIFDGIDWSTSRVLDQTVARINDSADKLALLPPWYDVDSLADWDLLKGHVRALVLAGYEDVPTETLRMLDLGIVKGSPRV